MSKERERVREEIANKACAEFYRDGMDFNEAIFADAGFADQILAIPGLCVLADDQSLPNNPYPRQKYGKAQQDMIAQNWRKIV